jgi:hypothetical protein
MDLQKLQEAKQHLLLEKEKQLANLYEITGALKLLDQQILEMQASEENQSLNKKDLKTESKAASLM